MVPNEMRGRADETHARSHLHHFHKFHEIGHLPDTNHRVLKGFASHIKDKDAQYYIRSTSLSYFYMKSKEETRTCTQWKSVTQTPAVKRETSQVARDEKQTVRERSCSSSSDSQTLTLTYHFQHYMAFLGCESFAVRMLQHSPR